MPVSPLWLLFGKYVNPGSPLAFIGFDRCDDTQVTRTFKLVETIPMPRKVWRLEKVYVHQRAKRIQYQSRKAQGSSPPGGE